MKKPYEAPMLRQIGKAPRLEPRSHGVAPGPGDEAPTTPSPPPDPEEKDGTP